jgi:serine/threonine protein kinase
LWIDRHGSVKLIDFGSARAAGLDETSSEQQIPSGADVTTPPEYLLSQKPSHSGDIFALGVLAYEILTGHLPYGRGISSRRHVDRLAYVPARTHRDDLPVWVDAALGQAVAKRPSERTEALSAFTENLRRPNSALGYERPRPLLQRNPITEARDRGGDVSARRFRVGCGSTVRRQGEPGVQLAPPVRRGE